MSLTLCPQVTTSSSSTLPIFLEASHYCSDWQAPLGQFDNCNGSESVTTLYYDSRSTHYSYCCQKCFTQRRIVPCACVARANYRLINRILQLLPCLTLSLNLAVTLDCHMTTEIRTSNIFFLIYFLENSCTS